MTKTITKTPSEIDIVNYTYLKNLPPDYMPLTTQNLIAKLEEKYPELKS